MRFAVVLLCLQSVASFLAVQHRISPVASRSISRIGAPPNLLFSAFAPKPTLPPPPPPVDPDDGSLGKSLRRLQGSPARAAMAVTYVAALAYVFTGAAPQGSPEDTIRIINECLEPAAFSPSTEVSLFFVVFNSLGVVPALFAAVLLPGAKDQPLIPPALIATSFFIGFGGLGPYLALRRPRSDPVALSELGFWAKLTESKIFAGAMTLSAASLAYKLTLVQVCHLASG